MADTRNDPSMEEILASIKRIIADDSATVLNAPRPRSMRTQATQADAEVPIPASMITPLRGEHGEEAVEEVLELTEEVAAAPVPPAAIDVAPATPGLAADGTPTKPELISSATAEASRHAFEALSSRVIKPVPGEDQTLEGLVREMLRPMLKEWLDARLPELVEGVVQREIARIAGRTL
ncbi:hypothetical protein SAMN06295912_1494 [Sphingomonas laterariae]|uniref:DUF2497 domain-containing protein n=1 Tax=Edaphosphingomonas laterariae TaxID=861865 RepID=A0A239K941_9SPHN|nr:DUF2497 domain-containing protein [Sphingomonas laterariae]SNT14976.1 hypothetical protein SAMN06295912_1494 [Sphingomonas laterariae]